MTNQAGRETKINRSSEREGHLVARNDMSSQNKGGDRDICRRWRHTPDAGDYDDDVICCLWPLDPRTDFHNSCRRFDWLPSVHKMIRVMSLLQFFFFPFCFEILPFNGLQVNRLTIERNSNGSRPFLLFETS